MRWISRIAAGCCLLLLVTACQTGPFARPLTEERVFAATPDEVFPEARALLDESGHRIRVSHRPSGRLEALSPIRADAGFRDAVQRRVRVSVTEEAPGRTRVSMTATLLEESEAPVHGRTTFERPLPDVRFYEAFFEALEARLGK